MGNDEGKEYKDPENLTFTVMNENGEEVECVVLFTFESGETGKNYLIYTDNSVDEEDSLRVYAAIYEPKEEVKELLPIETEREWEIIRTLIDEVQKDREDD